VAFPVDYNKAVQVASAMESRNHFQSSAKRSVIAAADDSNTSGSPSASIKLHTANQLKLPPHFSLLSPCFKESYFTSEYSIITNQRKLGGIYVIPSRRSAHYWFGVLFVHYGPYQGGVFRFTIKFNENFPDTTIVPNVIFQPPIFHPAIHPRRGTFDLTSHFNHGWSKSRHHIWHVLRVVRNVFYKVEESSTNKAANDLLHNDLAAFYKRAQDEAESSHKRFYEENPDNPDTRDAHWIKFSPYNPEVHDHIRAKALKPFNRLGSASLSTSTSDHSQISSNGSSSSSNSKGFSWMD